MATFTLPAPGMIHGADLESEILAATGLAVLVGHQPPQTVEIADSAIQGRAAEVKAVIDAHDPEVLWVDKHEILPDGVDKCTVQWRKRSATGTVDVEVNGARSAPTTVNGEVLVEVTSTVAGTIRVRIGQTQTTIRAVQP